MTERYGDGVIDSFDFPEGRVIGRKYEILAKVGEGWEGEVYTVKERDTDIIRTAKFLFPQRNQNNQASTFCAKKLHKLRECNVLIPYHMQDQITYRGNKVTFLISDYAEGVTLDAFLKAQPGKRLHMFQALHLLHSLVLGVESIHRLKEYHGDLHTDNIIVKRHGLGFKLKFLDFFNLGRATTKHIREDICDTIRIFYDILGGQHYYAKQPPQVKAICCGLKKSLILKKFKTISMLREHLENIEWD